MVSTRHVPHVVQCPLIRVLSAKGVWGHGYETETEYVRVYIRRLRAKLESDGGQPLILTQPRAGYRIIPEA